MNATAFFAAARLSVFDGTLTQSQVDGINVILDAWDKYGDGDARKLAYILATTVRETGSTMQPIEEYGKGAGHPYGVPTGPWHLVYDGRGDVQLTWEANYVRATVELHKRGMFLDVDLDKNPELALRPDIAAAVLILGMLEGWFTGRKLSDYIAAGVNYLGARAIVNGTDVAPLIAGYANEWLAAIKSGVAAGPDPVVDPQPPAKAPVPYPPLDRPKPMPKPPVLPTSGWALMLQAFVNLIVRIFAALPKRKAS